MTYERKMNVVVPRCAGVYSIENINTGTVYVGSSKNLWKRYSNHSSSLNNKTHICKKMQKEFNRDKYFFMFKVLEICDRRSVFSRERYWHKKIKPEFCTHYAAMGGRAKGRKKP